MSEEVLLMAQNGQEEKNLEWRSYTQEMRGKAVLVKCHGISFDVQVAGEKLPNGVFKLWEVRPGEIRARIFISGQMRYGVLKLRGNGELGLPVFIPSSIGNNF